MSLRTDQELIKIVTALREDYQPEAVIAAEKEIEIRNLDIHRIEPSVNNLADQEKDDKSLDFKLANSMNRFAGFCIDMVVFFLIACVLVLVVDYIFSGLNQGIIAVYVYFGYYIFMEFTFQKTIAKFITKTKVVMLDGQKPSIGSIIIRTIFRLIPFDAITFIFTKRGFHDYLSNTAVIKE